MVRASPLTAVEVKERSQFLFTTVKVYKHEKQKNSDSKCKDEPFLVLSSAFQDS